MEWQGENRSAHIGKILRLRNKGLPTIVVVEKETNYTYKYVPETLSNKNVRLWKKWKSDNFAPSTTAKKGV